MDLVSVGCADREVVLAIVAFVHNWNVVFLRICLCLLPISCCNSGDDDFRM